MVVSSPVSYGRKPCSCHEPFHTSQLIAVTGGPGAGKTAILDAARQVFCQHVVIVPEAATIVFSGGFWRLSSDAGRRSAQRAIFHVQRQLETILAEDRLGAVGLCDRGTVDGAAYWPGSAESYWRELDTTPAHELARYAAVIHLRTPPAAGGYNQQNPIRIESARVAAELDERIFAAWANHPRRTVVEANDSFATKLERALEVIAEHMPSCCRSHPITAAKTDS